MFIQAGRDIFPFHRQSTGEGTALESFAIGSSVLLPEGASGVTNHVWSVVRTGDLSRSATIDWAVTGTGANLASASDFVGGSFPSGTVTFLTGETAKSFTVPVQGDASAEASETYLVTLSEAWVHAVITGQTAIGTIGDDDSALTMDWTGVSNVIDTTRWATTFYQDRDGTVPVTASGQDVRCIRHPVSPNPICWQSPAAAPGNCWRLIIIGAVPYLEPKTTSADAILDTPAFGSVTQFFNWGAAIRTMSVINNARLLSPRTGAGGFYVNTFTDGGWSVYNSGGAADYKDRPAVAGTTRVYDGYIGDAFTAPEPWARFRIGTTVQSLDSGLVPDAANGPGVSQLDGIRLGGQSAGFVGFAADVRIRALYFHQAANNAGMLSQAKVDAANAFMQSLTL